MEEIKDAIKLLENVEREMSAGVKPDGFGSAPINLRRVRTALDALKQIACER